MPISFYVMRRWLGGFRYAISLTDPAVLLGIFGGAALLALAIAWLTTAGHAYRLRQPGPRAARRVALIQSSDAFSAYAAQFAGRRRTAVLGQQWSLCGEVDFRVIASNGNGSSTTNENARADGSALGTMSWVASKSWYELERAVPPRPACVTVTADCGGSASRCF